MEQPNAASAWPSYERVSLLETCTCCVLCAPLGVDFAEARDQEGTPWVGFSGLEMPRDHATDDMPSPMA